jgi:hypothetical protein
MPYFLFAQQQRKCYNDTMKRIIKKVLILFLGFLIFLTGQTAAETVKVKREIKSFMKKGVLQEDISTEEIKYYKVSRETYYPDEYYRDAFYDGDLQKAGAEGDLFVTRQAPIPDVPLVYDFVSFYFGGHAAYVGKDNILYDINGFPSGDETWLKVIFKGGVNTHISSTSNNWLNPNYRQPGEPSYKTFGSYYRKEWIGLRIKGINQEEIDQVSEFMVHLAEIEAQYNYAFIFFTKNKYYCTDMMSRAFATIINNDGKPKYNLNRDGVAVTVNDLILSKDTYISYYVWTDKNNVKHIYYID